MKICDNPDSTDEVVYIGTLSNNVFKDTLTKLGVDYRSLEGKFECYRLQNVGKNSFLIIGSERAEQCLAYMSFVKNF